MLWALLDRAATILSLDCPPATRRQMFSDSRKAREQVGFCSRQLAIVSSQQS